MADARGALHIAVEHDGEALADIVGREVAEHFAAFAVEFHGHAVALHIVEGIGRRDAVAGQVGALLDEETERLLLALDGVGVFLDDKAGRKDAFARIDLGEDGIALRVDEGEFEFGHALELFLGRSQLLRVEAGDLHEDAVATLRRDDRLAHAELVDALADDFDGLVERGRVHALAGFIDEAQKE